MDCKHGAVSVSKKTPFIVALARGKKKASLSFNKCNILESTCYM